MNYYFLFITSLLLPYINSFTPRYIPNGRIIGLYGDQDNNRENIEYFTELKNRRYSPMRNYMYKTIMVHKSVEHRVPDDVNITRFVEDFEKEFGFAFQQIIEDEMENEMENEKNNNNVPIKKDGYNDSSGVFRSNSGFASKNKISPNNNDENTKSDNSGTFQVIKSTKFTFNDVGGFYKIKEELMQTSDILMNYQKYERFNVRTPKGIIFEGPPGNGKTILAKGFCGELNVSFIPVSGSEFSEKYVGVGAARVRELFKTALDNKPCIIFIDEIDAIARKRGDDDSSSNSERDQTLNQLLISMDGFKDSNGVFVIGATNRIDLLDAALTRPGRMDKSIYFGSPDVDTRKAIINIHLRGKPIANDISIDKLVDTTSGFSGAQIENLFNEAMLFSLRNDREIITQNDLEYILNRMYAGWQTTENKYSDDIVDRIVIHEMGHAIVGILSKDHSKLSKIVLNLLSPKTPGYTIFESNEEDSNIHTKNGLFTRLMVLLAGRIAEEIFFGYSVTTGARHDLEQAYSLAKSMILNYGMGKKKIYPDMSDHSKHLIDEEINQLLSLADDSARCTLNNVKGLITDGSILLKRDSIVKPYQLINIIDTKYPKLWQIYDIRKRYTYEFFVEC